MTSAVFVSILALLAVYTFHQYRCLQKNIQAAKQSGFRYAVSPTYFQSIPWLLLQDLLIPFICRLPSSWTETWLPLSIWGRIWHAGYEPFRRMGQENILMVSASGNILWTCDPEVITQIFNRRNDFIKPIEMLGMLNLYGPTITASEGEEHRLYRRVASPSFNDENYHSVWTGAIEQTDMMIQQWRANDDSISDLNTDAAKLALHVVSKVFFGKTLKWADDGTKAGPGHTLTYGRAISSVFEHSKTIFMTPRPILDNSPMKAHKLAKEAFMEWGKYMEEMRNNTAQRLHENGLKGDGTLVENLVMAGAPELSTTNSLSISPGAVLGNMFVFILAGHETSANLFSTAVTLLACHTDFQKSLQADIDSILGGRRTTEWSYTDDYAKLAKSRIGALMKETLRLYSVLPFYPKVNKAQQTLKIGSQSHVLAANTLILINSSATHRNPKYWPKNENAAGDDPPYPMSDFLPERWLEKQKISDGFNPPEGAYIPFSEGYRSCIGKRFAEAEFCAAIATLFSVYSVELSRKPSESFEIALTSAKQQLSSGMGFEMGLKMKNPVPLKLVKRGH